MIVLSNLAGVAVDFFYLALAQVFNNPGIADLSGDIGINIVTCLVFMVAACYISYRGMETTKAVQYVLVAFQLVVLVWFVVAAIGQRAAGNAPEGLSFSLSWLNPFTVDSFTTFAAGVSLSIFIFWGGTSPSP